ncbi:MAG: hypothetical protein NTV03_01425 [Candidatus Nomurabacteria bacterium]|jgi:hypothetical protein|nr:hypothetical protein [Candidatus Nomurabacteria bacterium]
MKIYKKVIIAINSLISIGTFLFIIYILTNKSFPIEASIAYFVGILLVFQYEIRNLVFGPELSYKIKILDTTTIEGVRSKYYSLNIKNNGIISSKKIRVKIRSEKDKEWLNLKRPFWAFSKSIFIETLSSQEDEDFNIGSIDENRGYFELATDIIANNQRLLLNKGDKQEYYLQIVSDNTKPISFKISIDNKGPSSNHLISII